MNKEFVNYEQALALKELGFNEFCFAYYKDIKGEKVLLDDSMNFDGECDAPLYQQAFRWLIEEYSVYGIIHITNISKEQGIDCEVEICGLPDENGLSRLFKLDGIFKYQEAQDACLNKLIEIVKDGKHV